MNARPSSRARRLLRVALVATGALVGLAFHAPFFSQTPSESGYVGDDPVKFQTTEYPETPCGECHLSEQGVWTTTRHAKGFKDMHRRESAVRIAQNMGLRLIKRNSP